MKKSTWEVILKIIIAVTSAVAGAIGVSACGL
ncbi:MAG: smalltalk protein [Parabacteroides sp.]|nr:smalltalk protein [Parabacteroides sp.]